MRVWTVVFVEAAVLAELAALSVVSVVVVLEVLAESAVSAVVLVAVGASAEVSAVVLASAVVSAEVSAEVSAVASAQVSNGGDDLAEGSGVPRPRHGLHSTTLGSRGHIGDCTNRSYIRIQGRHIDSQRGRRDPESEKIRIRQRGKQPLRQCKEELCFS